LADLKQKLRIIIDSAKTGTGLEDVHKHGNRALGSQPTGLAGLATGAKVAMVAATAAAVGMGAAIYKLTSAAGDFQTSMLRVKAVSRATEDQFTALTGIAREMGSTTKFTATEAAGALQSLAIAGFSVDEAISALPKTLRLAASSGVGLGSAAKVSAGVIRGMRLEVDDLEFVVDGLATVATSATTDVLLLGESFSYASDSVANVGMGFSTAAAALGILGDNMLAGSRGGTALAAAIRRLLRLSTDRGGLQKRMTDLGLSFFYANGQMKPLVDIIGQLEEKSLSAQDTLILFETEGGAAINALVAGGKEKLQELIEKIEKGEGAAQDMADVMTSGWGGAVTEVESTFDSLKITLGDEFLPFLTDMLKNDIKPAIQKFDEWIVSVDGLGGAFTDAKTFAEGFFDSVGTLMKEMVDDEETKTKMRGYMQDIMDDWILAFADGLAAANEFTFALYNVFVTTIAGTLKAAMLAEARGFVEWEKEGINAMISVANALPVAVLAAWNMAESHATAGLASMVEKVHGFASEVLGAFGIELTPLDLSDWVDDTAPLTWEEAWAGAFETIGEYQLPLLDTEQAAVTAPGEVVKGWEGIGGKIVDGMSPDSVKAGERLGILITKATDVADDLAPSMKNGFEAVAAGAKTQMTEPIEKSVAELAKGVRDEFGQMPRESAASLKSLAENWQSFVSTPIETKTRTTAADVIDTMGTLAVESSASFAAVATEYNTEVTGPIYTKTKMTGYLVGLEFGRWSVGSKPKFELIDTEFGASASGPILDRVQTLGTDFGFEVLTWSEKSQFEKIETQFNTSAAEPILADMKATGAFIGLEVGTWGPDNALKFALMETQFSTSAAEPILADMKATGEKVETEAGTWGAGNKPKFKLMAIGYNTFVAKPILADMKTLGTDIGTEVGTWGSDNKSKFALMETEFQTSASDPMRTDLEEVGTIGAGGMHAAFRAQLAKDESKWSDLANEIGDWVGGTFVGKWATWLGDPNSGMAYAVDSALADGVDVMLNEGGTLHTALTTAGGTMGRILGGAGGSRLGSVLGTAFGTAAGSLVGDLVDSLGKAWDNFWFAKDKEREELKDITIYLDQGEDPTIAARSAARMAGRDWTAPVVSLPGWPEESPVSAQRFWDAFVSGETPLVLPGDISQEGYEWWQDILALVRAGGESVYDAEEMFWARWANKGNPVVAAASGFSGTVTEPTVFMTGESGPEHVEVTPSSMMQEPGFTGAAGPNYNFSITVQAWDSRDLDRYVREELGPKLVKYTEGYSRRGGIVTEDRGVRRVAAA